MAVGDTLVLGNTTWVGARNPQQSPSFAFEKYVQIVSSVAYPIVWTVRQGYYQYLSIVNFSNSNGVNWADDQGGNIPGSQWQNMNFSTSGTTDCTSRHLVIRNNINGGANETLKYITMAPGSCTSPTATPLFIHTQTGGSPWTITNIMLNHRGMYWGGGFQGILESIYCQHCIMPKITIANTVGGNVPVSVDLRNSVEDTTQQPIVAYGPNLTGLIKIVGTNGLAGNPQVAGYGGVFVSYEANGGPTENTGQNAGSKVAEVQANAVDGNFSTSGGPYPEQVSNASLQVGHPYKVWINSLVQDAPTCSVSAGGSLSSRTDTFQVAPVFSDSPSCPIVTPASAQRNTPISAIRFNDSMAPP